ncbi:hypothetical protein LMH87_011004 [Akanthomyces muscarius]|uniref:Uncharacterized protein n=1 Tax=Akanthomyces muscarius TaxID=2231603 RepID=A0A9W8UKI6_AKAMU|nr:hypothetical protein LMH87_011004 [Akanthomyces muscarius]KAJ4150246.1 hypothetical protein LMH87_011004 [Akanthomyces muscarius]
MRVGDAKYAAIACSPAATAQYEALDLLSQDQARANLQDRINKLESLVLDLMHQANSSSRSPMHGTQPSPPAPASVAESRLDTSPSPSDHRSFRHNEKVVSYVSSSHWAAVLDSITDLRNHLAQDDTKLPVPESTTSQAESVKLHCLPPRPTVDRLVSRYFNDLDIAPGVVHSGQFLTEVGNYTLRRLLVAGFCTRHYG